MAPCTPQSRLAALPQRVKDRWWKRQPRCTNCKYGGGGQRRHRNTFKTFLAFLTLSVIGAVSTRFLPANVQPQFAGAFGDLPPRKPGFLQSMSTFDAQISMRPLASLTEQRLAKRVQSYNVTYAAEEYGINWNYPSLVDTGKQWRTPGTTSFRHSPTTQLECQQHHRGFHCGSSVEHLDLASVNYTAGNGDDLPRKIDTTSKGVVPDYAEEFKGWSRLSPEWKIVNYDDEKTLKWLHSIFSGQAWSKASPVDPRFLHP